MKIERPTSMTVIAWLLIVPATAGALLNIYAFVASVPPYPRWVWAALCLTKCGILIAGLLLLKMRRLAVWIYLAATFAGWSLAFGVTNTYTPVGLWRYLVGLLLLGVYTFFVIRHWNKLLPTRSVGVRADA